MLDMSGSVFFSGRRAFNKPSDLYILGLNPAGDPAWPHTIRKNVEAVLHEYPEDWSAWRDERWFGRRPGENFRQRRVLYLLNQVGRGPGEVPCSEAIFLRSTDPNKIDMDSLAPLCWPFHEAVIRTLGVRVIVCLGGRAGSIVRRRVNAQQKVDEFVEDNRRRWRSRTHESADGLAVVTLAHPSQVDWTARSSDPTGLVQRSLSCHTLPK